MQRYRNLRISHFFYLYGPGSIYGGSRIDEIGIIPNLNQFIYNPRDELSEIENSFILKKAVAAYLQTSVKDIDIKKINVFNNCNYKFKTLEKGFFTYGWKVCRNKFIHRQKIGGYWEAVFKGKDCPVCNNSNGKFVYPFYFIGACLNGHLCQPDWWKIVHYKTGGKCPNDGKDKYLKFYQYGVSLEEAYLECSNCGNKLKMIEVIGRRELNDKLKKYIKCCGSYPEDKTTVNCGEQVVITRYISSYLRYSVNYDFISFPIDKVFMYILELILKGKKKSLIMDYLQEEGFDIEDEKFDCYYKEAQDIASKLENFSSSTKYYTHMLEYFLIKKLILGNDCHIYDTTEKPKIIEYNKYLRIVSIDEIKTYTVLLGYKRIDPNIGKLKLTPYKESDRYVYIALERPGEAVFFEFEKVRLNVNGRRYKKWKELKERLSKNEVNNFRFIDPLGYTDLNPEYVYLHTFAHLLIKAISKVSGFSVASLNDRVYLYKNPKTHEWEGGVMIYVSGEDVDGSLGGLISLFRDKSVIKEILEEAYMYSLECSNDPACETQEPVPHRLYGSACTVCSFLPETACRYFNLFIDRVLYQQNPVC